MKKFLTLACACLAAAAVPVVASARTTHHHHRNQTVTRYRSILDREYLTNSLQGDQFEIQGARIALGRSSSPSVDQLANRLIADHTRSYHQTAPLTRTLGMSAPTSPDSDQRRELAVLSSVPASSFNYVYPSIEIADHAQDIRLAQGEAIAGAIRSVRNNARAELPTLRQHLALSIWALASNASTQGR